MAKKQITLVTDDLTGEETDDITTVTFSLNEASYEIDLTPANAEKLADILAPYALVGRRVGTQPRRRNSGASSESAQIRKWAAQQGINLPSRGRIPTAIVEEYQARH